MAGCTGQWTMPAQGRGVPEFCFRQGLRSAHPDLAQEIPSEDGVAPGSSIS